MASGSLAQELGLVRKKFFLSLNFSVLHRNGVVVYTGGRSYLIVSIGSAWNEALEIES